MALLAALAACLPPAVLRAQEASFADSVEYAQQRTVKVYGASIGLVTGFGTGIIVSDDGRILTSLGVHLTAQRIRVGLPDGTLHEAKLERRAEALQVALLKIDAATPEYFQLSEKPVAQKGDWVLAVSNAFKVADGPEPLSVNLGVVSLRTRLEARRGAQDVDYEGDVLLIDAITSNPGAAGGAVVTQDGKLAGMIGKILEGKTTNTRLNYAVPSDFLFRFLSGESFEPARTTVAAAGKAVLGIRLFKLGGIRSPAYVDRVESGSPAAEAKIQSDDLIVTVAGNSIRDIRDYDAVVKTLRPNEEITIVIKRGNKLMQIQLTPAAEEDE